MIGSNAPDARPSQYPADEVLQITNQMARLQRHISDLTHWQNIYANRFKRLSGRASTLDSLAEQAHGQAQAARQKKVPARGESALSAGAYTDLVLNPNNPVGLGLARAIDSAPTHTLDGTRHETEEPAAIHALRTSVKLAEELIETRDDLRSLLSDLEETLKLTAYR